MTQPGISPLSATGDYRIDAILSSGGAKWGGQMGDGVTLTYAAKNPDSTYVEDYSDLLEPARAQDLLPNDPQIFGFNAAINAWAAVANINLVPVVESSSVSADIRLSPSRSLEALSTLEHIEAYAYAYLPTTLPRGGDVWLAPDTAGFDYAAGTSGGGRFLIMHELGHALLGLTDVSTTPGINGARLSETEDQFGFTIMSYKISPNTYANLADNTVTYPTTPMLYDILAAQAVYGPNYSYNSGDTNYRFEPDQQIFMTIWDGGGTDAIDWSNQTSDALIDLNDGAYSHLGPPRFDGVNYSDQTLAIAFNAVIENAFGGSGADTITGNEYGNVLKGGAGIDRLTGQDGADILYGNTDNDVLYGNTGADLLFGGQDADILFGGQDVDAVYGNYGFDILYGNYGNDLLYGGQDDDALYGGRDDDQLFGNLGNDVLFGNLGQDSLFGGDGDDTLNGANDNDYLDTGDGDDVAYGGSGSDYFVATDGDDSLFGDSDDDTIYGGAGNDLLDGGDDDDQLFGGEGDDNLMGGNGSDYLYGGEGNDQMDGGLGNDTYIVSNDGQTVSENGGGGTDVVETSVSFTLPTGVEHAILTGGNSINVTGNNSNNRITGNSRDNILSGLDGNDTLYGGNGADSLSGGAGTDQLFGGFGNDVYIQDVDSNDNIVEEATGGFDTLVSNFSVSALPDNVEAIILNGSATEATGNDVANAITGSASANLLSGRAGNDTIDGDSGADSLVGGSGNDLLTGGGGADVFIYSGSNLGTDTITDYESGLDEVQLAGGLTVASNIQSGSDSIVTLSSGDIITLLGVAPGDIEFTTPDTMMGGT